MATPLKPWLRGAMIAAMALGVSTLGVGSLVKAQQQSEPPLAAPPPETPPVITPAPADAPDEADDEPAPSSAPSAAAAAAKPVGPLPRPKYAIAIIQALDKVTAETERFEAPLNTPIRYKTLIFTVRACETTAADEDIIDAAAHVEVVSQPKAPQGGQAAPVREVFKGWMFSNSPGLNLLQHPVYDAWLIACKTEIPSA
jgi:hypothetical protein